MGLPRIRRFKFDIDRTFIIPPIFEGKPWAISENLYNIPDLYKPLCAANNVGMSYGTRVGIRPIIEAYINELKEEGLTENQIQGKINDYYYESIPSAFDWTSYENLTSGYVTDLYAGRILLVPTVDSAIAWINKYNTNTGI